MSQIEDDIWKQIPVQVNNFINAVTMNFNDAVVVANNTLPYQVHA